MRTGGHTVGFLGDGVDGVSAPWAADVGIAPRGATDVARERADVVLAEKDLTAIDHAIWAGRHSGGNIAAYLRITLSSNVGNVIAMLAAGLLPPFMPTLPAQVPAQNLCFATARLAFAYDAPHPALLRRPAALDPRALLVGPVLPASPLGPLLGLTALPLDYYLLLTLVLALHAAGLALARTRHERNPLDGNNPQQAG
ncbi:hypothetical protein ACWD5Q_01965 [Streptomyces sp. NPDC002513]